MVSEPPNSMLRAAPKNLFGGNSAVESTPPDSMRPLAGVLRLYARARRVMESRSITTSLLCSTSLFARSSTSSDTAMWLSLGWSNVEDMTSPVTERSMSVTSSGRSSTSRTISMHSGLFSVMEFAICLRTVVLPAFGGDTIRPLWPLPMGAIRSMIREVIALVFVSSLRRSIG